MALAGTVLGLGQDLGALFGHQNGMLELGRWASVAGSHRPSVGLVALRVTRTSVDHRFDGEAHAREQPVDAALSVREVRDRWIQVELFSQTMSDVFTNDGETTSFGFRDHRFANRRHATTWRQGVDCHVHAIKRTLRHGSFFVADFPQQERFALVAMPPIDDGGDVDVDDVAILQFIPIGNAVADDFVHAGAATLGILLVTQGCGSVSVAVGPIVDHLIQLFRGDSRFHMWTDVVHQRRVGLAGGPHHVALRVGKNQFSLLGQHAFWGCRMEKIGAMRGVLKA